MTDNGSEFALIERFFAAPSATPAAAARGRRGDPQAVEPDAHLLLGIGDDCALLDLPPGYCLAVSLDTLVAGRHFAGDADAADVGHKALAVNLSDLAAVGAQPAWVTLGLTLPTPDERWLADFCRGFFALAGEHGVRLIGGDTTAGPLTISVQAHGLVPPALALRRSGARPGDRIFVTGTLGDAALALAQPGPAGEPAERAAADSPERRWLRRRLERPTPRLAQGRDLRGLASAAIDVSDGLAQDLAHILGASGVGARLDPQRLPLSPAARALTADDPAAGLQAALSGGDDYELCFTVPPERVAALRRRAADWACGCSECGVIDDGPGLRLTPGPYPLRTGGYQHFGSGHGSGHGSAG